MSYHYHISFTQLHYAAFAAILTFTVVLIRQKYPCNCIYFKNQIIFFTLTSLIGPTSYSMIGPFLIWSNFDPAFLIKKLSSVHYSYMQRGEILQLQGSRLNAEEPIFLPHLLGKGFNFTHHCQNSIRTIRLYYYSRSLGQDGTTTRSGGKMAAMCGGEISGYYF